MILYGSRNDFEKALVKALSRYIGYTAAAYNIDRIFSVLKYFSNIPSAYGSEIISFLKSEHNDTDTNSKKEPSDEYLAETLNFSIEMHLIELVSDKKAQAKRYAPTQMGRSVMGAQMIADDSFYQFYRTKITLLADADAITPVLNFFQQKTAVQDVLSQYQQFHDKLRKQRLAWLRAAFSEKRLFFRIAERLPWLKKATNINEDLKIEQISINTARHHVTPRKQWLTQLGLIDKSGITTLGTDVLSSLIRNQTYFWLGPVEGVQDALGILEENQKRGPFEDTILLPRNHTHPSANAVDSLVDATAEIMRRGYEGAKLVYAPQASLELPIEYIAYRSYIDKTTYNWRDVFDILFKRHRSSLQRLSARKGPVGFYKAREQ